MSRWVCCNVVGPGWGQVQIPNAMKRSVESCGHFIAALLVWVHGDRQLNIVFEIKHMEWNGTTNVLQTRSSLASNNIFEERKELVMLQWNRKVPPKAVLGKFVLPKPERGASEQKQGVDKHGTVSDL